MNKIVEETLTVEFEGTEYEVHVGVSKEEGKDPIIKVICDSEPVRLQIASLYLNKMNEMLEVNANG